MPNAPPAHLCPGAPAVKQLVPHTHTHPTHTLEFHTHTERQRDDRRPTEGGSWSPAEKLNARSLTTLTQVCSSTAVDAAVQQSTYKLVRLWILPCSHSNQFAQPASAARVASAAQSPWSMRAKPSSFAHLVTVIEMQVVQDV